MCVCVDLCFPEDIQNAVAFLLFKKYRSIIFMIKLEVLPPTRLKSIHLGKHLSNVVFPGRSLLAGFSPSFIAQHCQDDKNASCCQQPGFKLTLNRPLVCLSCDRGVGGDTRLPWGTLSLRVSKRPARCWANSVRCNSTEKSPRKMHTLGLFLPAPSCSIQTMSLCCRRAGR